MERVRSDGNKSLVTPVFESSWDPAVLRTVHESADYGAGLDNLRASAPPEIAADVEVHSEWLRQQFVEVVKSFDFDVRRLLLEGSPHDVAIFQQTDPAVGEHYGREIAFQEQVCSL